MVSFANAFSVTNLGLHMSQGCSTPGLELANAFGVNTNQQANGRLLMKKLVFIIAIAFAIIPLSLFSAHGQDLQRWEQQARNVTITRDDWGIAHVNGKTDADAVFGAIYAQAEDDFNRVETNYINSMGRLAEAEGEAAIWRDLRMKIFIDPIGAEERNTRPARRG